MAACTMPAAATGGCGCCLILAGWIAYYFVFSTAAGSMASWHAEDKSSFSFTCENPDVVIMYIKQAPGQTFAERMSQCGKVYDSLSVKFDHATAKYPEVVKSLTSTCDQNQESPEQPSALAFLHQDYDTNEADALIPLDNAAGSEVSVRRRLTTTQAGIAGFDWVAMFTYYDRPSTSGKTDKNGAPETECVPGNYAVKSSSGTHLWAMELGKKIAEAVGGFLAMAGGGLVCIGMCCCGGCLSCLGVVLALAASPANRVNEH